MKLADKLSIGISRLRDGLGANADRAENADMRLHDFDEDWYLSKYSDVAASVRAGDLSSGREHFVRHGFAEGRLGFAEMRVGATDVAELDDTDTVSSSESEVSTAEELQLGDDGAQVDHVFNLGNLIVVVGRCIAAVETAELATADGQKLEVALFATHRFANRRVRGFILAALSPDGRALPASVLLRGDAELLVGKFPRRTDFVDFSQSASTESLLELFIAADRCGLSVDEIEILSRSVRPRLLRSAQSYIETSAFAASIDVAVVGRTTGALFFSGWLLRAATQRELAVHYLAFSARGAIAVKTFTDFVERPDLIGFGGKYLVSMSPGFVGFAPDSGMNVFGPAISILVKDAAGYFHVVLRTLDVIEDASMQTVVVNQLTTTLTNADKRPRIGRLLMELFPFSVAAPTEIVIPATADAARTCHLYLVLGAEATELQSVLEEIVQDRFDRVTITCMADRAENDIKNALRGFAVTNPDKQIEGRVVANASKSLLLETDAQPRDLVIFGRPFDILQFDASEGAIDAAIRDANSVSPSCRGYFYNELSAIHLHGSGPETDALEDVLSEHLFESTTGFAAMMPAAYFSQLESNKVPLVFPANEVKALVIALAKVGLAKLQFFDDPVFYGSADDALRLTGLDNKILAQLDFVRTVAGMTSNDWQD